MKTRTVKVKGIEFGNASEAIQHADASGYGDDVVTVGGRYFLVRKAEGERLDRLGVVGAFHYDRDGVLMSVPTA